MAKIKGNDLILFIRKEEEYKALAYSTTCEIDIQADTIEIGSPDTGQWTKKKKKRKNWRASSGYLISDSVDAIDVFKTLVGNESVSLIIGTVEPHALSVNADEYVPDERLTIKGDGIITRMTITGKRGDFVTMSIDIEGSGALDIKIKEWIIISPKSIQASPLMSSYKVEVKSNTRWSFSVVKGSDFISYEGKNQGKGNGDAVFKIGTNISGTTRTGIVKFITENMEGAILKINQESTTPSVSIDQDTLSVIRQGGNYTIHVSANTDWQIDYHPSWVTLSQESGGAGEFDITVTVSPNTASTSREDDIGFVTVVEGGEGANCVVTQTAEGNYLYADTNVVALAQEGTSVSIGFNSNLDVTDLEWGSVEGSEWASISVDDNDWVLNISAQSNAGGSTRTGKVFVQTSDGGIRVEITINQAGEISSDPYVRPASNYVFFDTNNEGSQLLELDTNVGIDDITSAPISGSWCNCSIQESDGKKYLKIDVDYSNENDPRIGMIALLLSDGAKEAFIISVGQMGAYNNVITYSPLIYIGPEPTILQENAIPRSYTQMRYYVICDNMWVVTDQASFAQMDTTAGGTDGEPTMTEVFLNVTANDGTTDRVGDIVMMDSDSNEVTMSLTQEVEGLWIGLSGGDLRRVTNAAQDVSITFPSDLSALQIEDVEYEILDGGTNWIDYTNKSISGSQFTYTFSVNSNATGATRIARILIKYADIKPIVITISQQA
nr:MAG TPA: major tail protein [Caudoviricetes sp.]